MANFNKPLKILLFTISLALLSGAMIGPIYALFVEGIGGDLLSASITFAAFAFFAAITTLLTGKLFDDTKDSELILALGYFVLGLGYLLYMFVNSITFLLIVQAIIGIGTAIYVPAFETVFSKYSSSRKFGSSYEFIKYIAIALGSIIGGFIGVYFGFKVIFVIMVVLCFASALYIYKLPKWVL
ncbi:MAG: MFS transporter [archaeon]